MHLAVNSPRGNRRIDAALENLDVALLMLMAAFDVTAHDALGFAPNDRRRAGWQSEQWRSKVAEQDSALAAIFEEGSPGRTALDVVRILRNSIHGEALEGMEVVAGSKESMEPDPAEAGKPPTVWDPWVRTSIRWQLGL